MRLQKVFFKKFRNAIHGNHSPMISCADDCPLVRSKRSSFTSQNVAMVASGVPILSDVYCHVISDSSTLSYLNLYEVNEAFSDHPEYRGSM